MGLRSRAWRDSLPVVNTSSATDLFHAARTGDLAAVRAYLDAGAAVAAENPQGFTALECAAMGLGQAALADSLAILRLLVDAGSPLDHVGLGGRTALYLTAEFARDVEPVQLLADAGAAVDICDSHGNHVIVNAMMPAVKAFISTATGRPVPAPRPPEPKPVKMSAADWRAAKQRLDPVFATLAAAGLVVLQDAGTTQEDGFADCTEIWQRRGGAAAGLHGFCFYTRQDLTRAKRTSALTLAFWGAPEGAEPDMQRVGKQVVEAFERAGYSVAWSGSGARRPTVYLQAELTY